MMKKIFFVFSLLAVVVIASAQSHYYHLVGDTVRGKCPIYHYSWWPTLNANNQVDSALGNQSHMPGFMKHEISTPLKIVGIASTTARVNITDLDHIYEEIDTTIDSAWYYVLYDATPNGIVELARECFTCDYYTHPKRYMELPRMSGDCDNMIDRTAIAPLREYYFDSAITVTDSFYLGCRFQFGYNMSGLDEQTHIQHNEYISNHLVFYYTYYTVCSNTDCSCYLDIPEFSYYNQGIYYNNGHWADDTAWRFTANKFTLVFPIIEVDTVGLPYDTALFSCPVPENPHISTRDDIRVRVEWNDSRNYLWQVSRTPLHGDPENGLITETHLTHLDFYDMANDSSYSVYVRGRCKTAVWEGWGEWSSPCNIDALLIGSPSAIYFSPSPNPASGMVTVTSNATHGNVTVLDLQGRSLLSCPLSGHTTLLDIKTLPAGTYIIRITTSQGSSFQKLSVE